VIGAVGMNMPVQEAAYVMTQRAQDSSLHAMLWGKHVNQAMLNAKIHGFLYQGTKNVIVVMLSSNGMNSLSQNQAMKRKKSN
tara:strand:+ start:36 stop:281 length:246 start_codon:yes stop_codon:yes gene_type:complete